MWNKLVRYSLYGFLFLFHWMTAVAQERVISGTVKSTTHEALASASVKLVDDRSTILRFAITDKQGAYSLSLPAQATAQSLWLEVSYIGYTKQRLTLSPQQATYHFILAADDNMLSAVTVKNKPVIEVSGDTLKYYVSSFAAKEDRSIADVLRRMPGIDILPDGSIYYNGKKIENLYIHGDDLMDGKYGLATRTIRKEMILRVDVIRNHQPIQVLKDKVVSDKTALNLVLKDENSLKLSATATVGVGLPSQYDVSLTPIVLNKTFKMINTVAFNNSGVDYRNDFKQLGASNLNSSISNTPSELALSLATIGPPDLPLVNYYFNRSGMANLNTLYNTRKGLQLKANVQGYVDRNSLDYYSRVDNYLSTDTVSYREQQSYYNKPLLLNGSFNMMVNKPGYYFNNNSRIKLSRDRNSSRMDFNDHPFGQSVNKEVQEFSNDLNWIPALHKKGIAEVRWLLSYTRDQQLLNIGEGYYFASAHQPGYYDEVHQQVKLPTLFSNAYAGYRIPGTVFSQEYKAGFISESQRLGSALALVQDNQSTPYAGDVGNDLRWRKNQLYLSTEYQLKRPQWTATAQLPVTYQSIYYAQTDYALRSQNRDVLFNPSLSFRYDLTSEQGLRGRYSFNNGFGNITGVYRGAILENYRLLLANDAGLQQKSTHLASFNYEFQRSIKMLFLNAGLLYEATTAETLLSTVISDNIQQVIVLPYRNRRRTTSFNAGFSQYIFALKTTASLKAQVRRSSYVQLINERLLPFYGDALVLNGTLVKKAFDNVSISYQPNAMWGKTQLQENKEQPEAFKSHTFRLDQHLTLGFTAFKRLLIEASAKHSYNQQSGSDAVQYFFMDSKLRYSNTKKGIDLSLYLTNLFNVTDYTRYSIFANQVVSDQYTIRGRMAILRFDYYF